MHSLSPLDRHCADIWLKWPHPPQFKSQWRKYCFAPCGTASLPILLPQTLLRYLKRTLRPIGLPVSLFLPEIRTLCTFSLLKSSQLLYPFLHCLFLDRYQPSWLCSRSINHIHLLIQDDPISSNILHPLACPPTHAHNSVIYSPLSPHTSNKQTDWW